MDAATGASSSEPGSRWRTARSLGGAAVLAWGGMVLHNLADLPQVSATSRENTWPAAVWVLLVGLCVAVRRARWPVMLLWGWGLVNLLGGALSVLPLTLWPYRPEQSLRHYMFHGLYAVTQLPLLALAQAERRRRRRVTAVRAA